jgi:hypothetical protein
LLHCNSGAREFSTSRARPAPLNLRCQARNMVPWPTRLEGTMKTLQDFQTFAIMAVPTVIVVLAALISIL